MQPLENHGVKCMSMGFFMKVGGQQACRLGKGLIVAFFLVQGAGDPDRLATHTTAR